MLKSNDSQEANCLYAQLFLCEGADVMLTSNLWTTVGLHNGDRGRVVDFEYTISEEPFHPSKQLLEAMVVEFGHLHESVPLFLFHKPKTVAIPPINAEWTNTNGDTMIRKQFPLMLSLAFTVHKSQGKTLDRAVIDLGKAEKCIGMTLVALSRVQKLEHMLLKPFSLKDLRKLTNQQAQQFYRTP